MNVLYFALDTLRADHLGCYGYAKPTSPNIDSIARKGILFKNSFSHTNCTQPGFTTISTGMYSITHDIIAHDGPVGVREGLLMTPEILKRLGYVTLAVDNLVHMREWLGRGYDDYRSITAPDESPCNARAEAVAAETIKMLEKYKDERFFLFVHFWDPHQPYGPPPEHDIFYEASEEDRSRRSEGLKEWRKSRFTGSMNPGYSDPERIIALYDGEIHYADECVGKILRKLEELHLDDTLVVVFSDHGEILNEPQCTILGQPVRFSHLDLYDNCIRVPLVFYHPKRFPRAKILPQMVQHIDILPTVLGIIGAKPEMPYELEGLNLLPLIEGKANETRDWIELSEHTYQAKRGVRTLEWKFLRIEHDSVACRYGRPRKELYDLKYDPEETQNVIDVFPDVASELESKLDNWIQCQLDKWQKPDPMLIQPIVNMGMTSLMQALRSIRTGTVVEEVEGLKWQQGVAFGR